MFKVLLVEDSEADALLTERKITAHVQHETIVVTTLAAAVKHIESDPSIDLILLDLNLPDAKGTFGIETLDPLTSCPIVVLTGQDDNALARECVRAGAYTFLLKDEVNGSLARAILAAVERRRAIREEHEDLRDYIRQKFAPVLEALN